MTVFDLGYRPLETPKGGWLRPIISITRRSFATNVRWPFFAILVTASFPLFFKLLQVYSIGLTDDSSELPRDAVRMFSRVLAPYGYGDGIYFELISIEIFFVVILMMVTGAGQIAEDFRTGALQIYFSRPIDQAQYLLGKLGAVVLYGLTVTLAPCIVLFAACCAFAPDWSFLTGNPYLPLKFTAFSLLVSGVLGAAVLALSALGRNGRMVGIAFAGGYFFSTVLGRVLPKIFEDRRWEVVHIGNALDAVGRSFFTTGPEVHAPLGIARIIVIGVLVAALALFAKRVNPVEVVS
jgi:ABC-type transport system involved in multi-copper enzyme maturation permease subunit